VRASEFTTSSYLALASESTLLRHNLTTMLNNIRQTLLFDDVKRLSEEIDRQIQKIPDWTGDSADGPRALLALNLRQYLLVLHDRLVRQAESTAERSFSRMMVIDTATRIIDTHRMLIDKGCLALELMCHDQLRAALSICHVATTVNIQADSAIGQIIEHHANRIMDETIQMLTDKVIRFGREQRQLWIVLAAHGFWKSKKDPTNRAAYLQEAVDKVTRPYYKIMACQEDAPIGVTSNTPNADRTELPNGLLEYLPPVPQQQVGPVADMGGPLALDIDEIEAWTFENWAFNPMELQQAFGDPYQPVVP